MTILLYIRLSEPKIPAIQFLTFLFPSYDQEEEREVIAIENSPLQYRIITVDETASTNDLAKVCPAGPQKAWSSQPNINPGQRSAGREWYSQTEACTSPSCSDPTCPLPKWRGHAVGGSGGSGNTETALSGCRLKWPNDVIIASRKIAGCYRRINQSGRSNYIIVGIELTIRLRAATGINSSPSRVLSDFTNLTIENQVLLRQF